MRRHQLRLLIDSLLLGVVGALATQLFNGLLKLVQSLFLVRMAGYSPPGLPDEGGALNQVVGSFGLWLVPLSTTLGGLISGLLVFTWAPEAEGHGTDTAVKAFHANAGKIRFRVPPLKLVASALTIGSGGAAGREGPTALITAGMGSEYASFTRRSEEDRRTLVLVGMAAGLSAMFRSPIGAALFAIEVLYSDMEFEVGALVYALFSAIVAYAVNGLFVSWQPLFYVPRDLALHPPHEIGFSSLAFIVLGIVSGLVAAVVPSLFYGVRDLFLRLPIPLVLKPALGGLALGLLALAFPQILGGGYGWIQEAIQGHLAASLLAVLVLAKLVALSLTVASGGSGGIFAPTLYIGAMLGGVVACVLHQPPAAFVMVGMASVFGGAARVPIATLLMVTEMTGGYELLVPAALAVLISFLIQSALTQGRRYKSLYESQVAARYESPAHIVEHIKIAADLIAKKKGPSPSDWKPLPVESLLAWGIPILFPDGERLGLERVDVESTWCGKALSHVLETGGGPLEVISILRGENILAPHPSVILHSGDRVLALGTERAWKALRAELT